MCDVKTVYLPRDFCKVPPGILLGTIDSDENAVYVVAIVHLPITPERLRSYLQTHHFHDGDRENTASIHPLGIWYPIDSWESEDEDLRCLLPNLFAQDTWMLVTVYRNEQGNATFKVEHQHKADDSSSKDIFSELNFMKTPTDTILVLYRQSELWDGEIVDGAFLKKVEHGGSVEKLYETTRKCKKGILRYESGFNPPNGVTVSHCCVKREVSIAYFLLGAIIKCMSLVILFLLTIGHRIVNALPSLIVSLIRLCGKFIDYSSLLSHIRRRVCNFSESLSRRFALDFDERKNLADFDVLSSVFVDILLGVIFLCVLQRYDLLWSQRTTKEVFMPYVESIASQVEELIKWLMGIPAGLKLNDPLNQFLGHFFLYHVRLWLEYAKMMMALFPNMITYCLLCSGFGFSVFVNLVADAVSTLSFHVYCFYVYAGRLYGLQVSGLMSMWRLFRGKKWNPLRKRVDSLAESGQRADQLFAGTLLFTVLLFLLPTTALYYGIFLLLRIGILAVQVLLSRMCFITSEFPYYSVLLRITKPHRFIKTMRITWLSPIVPTSAMNNHLISHEANQAITLSMRIDPLNLKKVIQGGFAKRTLPTGNAIGLKAFLKKMVTGDLIRWS